MSSASLRILFFSDAHGAVPALQALRARVRADAPDLVCFLGDALYHGPRNDIPGRYDPQRAADEFNALAEQIVAVRGNCDAEVDQCLISFPILGDYATVLAGDRRIFLSHGHAYGPDAKLPPLPAGTLVATGHTHAPILRRIGDLLCFNPGSISIPKGGSEASYALLDGTELFLRRLADGSPL